ncbi:MAG: DUF998 domain-containing protein [Candidatus Hermodarchaeota archaeon]
MVIKIEQRMEIFFGLFGVIIANILLLGAVLFTPDYSPLKNTVSSLGEGVAKSLFSISFVVVGSLNIPFYIYLERELVNIKESIRRLATGISIFTSVCVALVGIIPDETYPDIFVLFHNFVALVSFIGSSIYIVLYSILMHKGPKSKLYSGPGFKKYLAFFGYFIGVVLLFFAFNGILISFGIHFISLTLIEWILTILISIWIFITAIQLISFKFFNIPGVYYKRTQFPEALKMFEAAMQILNKLNLKDEPITETIKENIEFLKKQLEKES